MELPIQRMNITTQDKRQLRAKTYPAFNSDKVALVFPDSEYGNRAVSRPYHETALFMAKYGLTTVLVSNEVSNLTKQAARNKEEDFNLERTMEFFSNTVLTDGKHVSVLAFMSGATTVARNLNKYGDLIDNLVLINPHDDEDALEQIREYKGEHFTAVTSPDGSDTALEMYVESGASRTTFDVLYDSNPTLPDLAKCPQKFAELGKYVLIPALKR